MPEEKKRGREKRKRKEAGDKSTFQWGGEGQAPSKTLSALAKKKKNRQERDKKIKKGEIEHEILFFHIDDS